MAWTTPSTVVAGQTLSAAFWNEQVRDNAFMGRAVYANEAARDAAIPSPEEGMICYLTAPTIPAATGETTFVPSGITTIYNGSAWVCVTPVGAFTSNFATTTSSSFTPTLSGTPGINPSVTLVTGTTALVQTKTSAEGNTLNSYPEISVAVSGASTIGANVEWGTIHRVSLAGSYPQQHAGTVIISGLTAGTNTFTMQYRIDTGTLNCGRRTLTVQGIA